MHTGAGDVTSSVPENSRVIAHFEGEGGSYEVNCKVKNNSTQTDTVWSIENYMGRREHQSLINDEMFTISGSRRSALLESNYGNYLKITNCSSKELNGSVVYCGSYGNPQQRRFEFKICSKLYDLWFCASNHDCILTHRGTNCDGQ